MTGDTRHLEVWGQPIAHSKSPDLHRAAYHTLGLPWSYGRREVAEEDFCDAFWHLDDTWQGLSLTMPLKEVCLSSVSDQRGLVGVLGAANTVVRGADGWWLDATDPQGVAALLRALQATPGESYWILGGGATARSILAALADRDPERVTLAVRDPKRADRTLEVGKALGVGVKVINVADLANEPPPSIVLSTVPGSASSSIPIPREIIAGSRFADVAYHPWPTALAAQWLEQSRPVESGLTMLLFQAVGQVRAFVMGDSEVPLPDEVEVIRAMARSIGQDPDRMVSLAVKE